MDEGVYQFAVIINDGLFFEMSAFSPEAKIDQFEKLESGYRLVFFADYKTPVDKIESDKFLKVVSDLNTRKIEPHELKELYLDANFNQYNTDWEKIAVLCKIIDRFRTSGKKEESVFGTIHDELYNSMLYAVSSKDELAIDSKTLKVGSRQESLFLMESYDRGRFLLDECVKHLERRKSPTPHQSVYNIFLQNFKDISDDMSTKKTLWSKILKDFRQENNLYSSI